MNDLNLTEMEIAAITIAINTYLTQNSDSTVNNNYLTPWKISTFNNIHIANDKNILGWNGKAK